MNFLTIIGARPQFIKSSILTNLLNRDQNINHKVLNTGQHYDFDMYKNILKSLNIKQPDFNLRIKNSKDFLDNCIKKIEKKILQKFKPELIITYGDTQSTLLAGIIAKKIQCKLAHIEAGLRSYNYKMPEELNRLITDHLADYLFTPNINSKKILIKENVKGKIYAVGDVMYDIFVTSNKIIKNKQAKILKKYSLQKNSYVFLTIHRNENTLTLKVYKKVIDFIKKLKLKKTIIFPAHPRLKNFHNEINYPPNIKLIRPVDYIETQALLANSSLCLTDSGGLQKEAYFNGVRCLTLRNETEWMETVENGWNVLWTKKNLKYNKQKKIMYGDGNASKKIYKILLSNL
jgi:UDP-GlcNAc3NAcA epimerase